MSHLPLLKILHPVIPSALAVGLLALAVAAPATAQSTIRVDTDAIDCLPIGENGAGFATVENNVPDTTVRLNFRRMHDTVEDLYWVNMKPAGQGRYWGVFPKAEDRALNRFELIETREEVQAQTAWADWWREKDSSDHRDPTSELDRDLIR